MKLMTVCGKVADLFHLTMVDTDKDVVEEYDGYVPRWSGLGDGDYVKFTIDMETGQIVDWDSEDVIEFAFEHERK